MEAIAIIGITLFAALLASIAQYFFKKAMPHFKFNAKEILALFKNKTILLGILIYFIGLGIYLIALYHGQLSFVYPTFASSFVFTLLISKYMLGEKVNAARAIGIVLIVIGIIAIAFTY